MNVNYTAEELAFRDEVRAFLKSELPADIAAKVKLGKHMSKQDHELVRAGLAGGTGRHHLGPGREAHLR